MSTSEYAEYDLCGLQPFLHILPFSNVKNSWTFDQHHLGVFTLAICLLKHSKNGAIDGHIELFNIKITFVIKSFLLIFIDDAFIHLFWVLEKAGKAKDLVRYVLAINSEI